jgi:hypothetical protein
VPTRGGFQITVYVEDAVCLGRELFVFQRKPGTVAGTILRDEFSHIASPADLEEYEVGEPESHEYFFRLDNATFVFRSITLLRDSLRDIKNEILSLIQSIEDMMVTEESVVVIE